MEKLSMCRVCLVEDTRLRSVVETHLQEMYESLVLIPLESKDSRPTLICYICCAKLQNCYELRRSCLRNEELFTQMSSCDELEPVDNKKNLTVVHNVVHLSIGHELQMNADNVDDVKVEQNEAEDINENALEENSDNDDIQFADSGDNPLIIVKEKLSLGKTTKIEKAGSRGRPRSRSFDRARGGNGGRARGAGRARGRGLGVAREIVSEMPQIQENDPVEELTPVARPSQAQPATSMAEEIKKIKKIRALDRKNIARLTIEQQTLLTEFRIQKQESQFLLPDAPPAKKSRNSSPPRISCPLVPGTPEVPPPHIPQPWELKRRESSLQAGIPSRFAGDKEARDASTPPHKQSQRQLLCTPSKDKIPDDVIVAENFIVDAGFLPSTSLTPKRSSPLPSTSSTRPEPPIYEDDVEEAVLNWELSLNPGSDVEEDVGDDGQSSNSRRHAGEFTVEELPGELCEVLDGLDKQDDQSLREVANQDMLDFDWSNDPAVFVGERENFIGRAGTTFTASSMTPFQIFAKIWDEDIITLVVRETNKYGASLCSDPTLPQCSRLRKWIPVTPQELWTFFGILMLQSLAPIPVEREYWTPCLSYLKIGNFADIMPFNRFILIKRCLYFVDNDVSARGVPNKLTKIKPIIDHLNRKFSSLYLPERDITIDESLLLWKGRLSFSQLIANKAAQVGIKSYELCESKSGYLWQMIVYTGKNEGHNIEPNVQREAEPESAASKIVYSLVRPLLNKGHTLVMDNFYNSPLLSRTLKAQKTDVMGTLRLNREFVPDSLRCKNKANMRTGEVAFSQTKDITIVVWKDANVVSMISTFHKVEVGGKEKYGYYKYKPKVVLDYNLSMGGVDKKDQLLQAFPVERIRNATWFKKLFRRLLNVSIHNTFVMFPNTGKPKMAQRQFRINLADEIVRRFQPPKIQAPIAASGHYPARNGKKKARCKWCAMKKVDTCTVWMCDTCNVNLCILGCFKNYHTSVW